MKMTGVLHLGKCITQVYNILSLELNGYNSFLHSEDKFKFIDNDDKKEGVCDSIGQELTLSGLSLDTSDGMATTIGHNQIQMGYSPPYYIQVIEEPAEFHDSEEFSSKAIDSVNNSSSEAYEKTSTKHGDKIFYKFHKRLSRCPQQVLRCVGCR